MIQVENLSKYFGPVMAVDRISFSVGQGKSSASWASRRRQDDDHAHPHQLHARHQRAWPASPAMT